MSSQHARIALVSFELSSGSSIGSRAQRRTQLLEIIQAARKQQATHVLFPGWTLVYTPAEHSGGEPQRDLDWLSANGRGLSIMAELTIHHAQGPEFQSPPEDLGFVSLENGRILDHRIRQVFAQSDHVKKRNELYSQLADDIFAGRRTVTLGGITFLVLVCGESNFLKNLQSQHNSIRLRHEVPGQTLPGLRAIDYQVAFNPAHTELGNLGKMYRRWEWLSQPKRICMFTTNVMPESSGVKAMYCFKNGNQQELPAKMSWPDGKSWIMEIVEV